MNVSSSSFVNQAFPKSSVPGREDLTAASGYFLSRDVSMGYVPSFIQYIPIVLNKKDDAKSRELQIWFDWNTIVRGIYRDEVYTMEYTKEVTNRMKRLEGQVRGVLKMMDDGKDCKEVVTQLSAVRTAVDRTIGLVVAKNLEACIKDSEEKGMNTEEAIQEAVNLLVRSR